MQAGVDIKYIILFAILIALTGFSFEFQSNSDINVSGNQTQIDISSKPPKTN